MALCICCSPDFFQVHQMQQEPDNPQAWSHECTDSNVNLCCLGGKWKIPWCSVKCFIFKYQIPPKLHNFLWIAERSTTCHCDSTCFLCIAMLKAKKSCSVAVRIDVRREHQKPLIFKMEYETEDCVLPSFYKNDTKWITTTIHPSRLGFVLKTLFGSPNRMDPEDVDFTRSDGWRPWRSWKSSFKYCTRCETTENRHHGIQKM